MAFNASRMGKSDREERGVIRVRSIKKIKALIFLSLGIALLAYALLAINSLMISARAVLMMGSVAQPGSAVSNRVIAAVFLVFLFVAGLVSIVVSIKSIVESYKE
jgi:hypothetical protein